jgi:hypothetical protein
MSTCTRCGAEFGCAMVDGNGDGAPCWCATLPPVVTLPLAGEAAGQRTPRAPDTPAT